MNPATMDANNTEVTSTKKMVRIRFLRCQSGSRGNSILPKKFSSMRGGSMAGKRSLEMNLPADSFLSPRF
jgi:hypothetical protein